MTTPDAQTDFPITITRENRHLVFSAKSFFIPIMKESGYSSGFFVNQVRRRLSKARGVKRFKVGHAGTLDPFADGVLLLLCGGATKLQDARMKQPKEYIATISFGAATPSLDPDTDVSERDENFTLDPDQLAAALPGMVGEIDQMPPRYSAKHVGGKRAYELARQGDDVEIALSPKRVVCHELELLAVQGNTAQVRVSCGAGYYVRCLARDLARELGTLGYLTELRRTQASGFALADCLSLREVLDAQPQPSEA